MQKVIRGPQMIKLIHDKAENQGGSFDLIFTDPPFELSGAKVFDALENFEFEHLVLIASMHQIIDFAKVTNLTFCFDMVVSHITPKKSKSYTQPHYLHSNIVYFKKVGIKSAFDRRKVQRCDHYSDSQTHYYPSIFHAPKQNLSYKYQKNQLMINDLIGAFNAQTVCDPFAGSGTTGLACLEHGKQATLIEAGEAPFQLMKKTFDLLGVTS